IVADVVIRLFHDVKKYMKENGILIVPGIIDIRESDLEKSAFEHGFKMIKKLQRKEWRAYVYKK
ncbi:MAG: 50S ribosomal protein L11 methyltransferase, partial [Clostridia bacterium]|nr:50S ribosomal protein L11 methyltransferase [Clostridia bacterium]